MQVFQGFINFYRDPLFGVIMLVLVVGVVAAADYARMQYRRKKSKQSLDNISSSFRHSGGVVDGLRNLLEHATDPMCTLMPIANLYSKSGNHEQAISIYTDLLDRLVRTSDKVEVLEALGISYCKAGFLHRAKKVFLEVIKIHPSNTEALRYLIVTCESMGLYTEALEALDCVEEIYSSEYIQGGSTIDIKMNRNYLQAMEIIANQFSVDKPSNSRLLKIYDSDQSIHGFILRHFKIHDLRIFWDLISVKNDVSNYIDILWSFDSSQVPYSHIKNNHSIMQVYCAKGYVGDFYMRLDHFHLEIVRLLNKYSLVKGDLHFSFMCASCSAVIPFYSHRCPACYHVGESLLTIKPVKVLAV